MFSHFSISDIPALRKKAREQARRIRELQTWAQNVAVDSSSSNNNPPPDSDPSLSVPLIQTQNEPPALPSESSTSVTWPIKKAGGSTSEEEDSDSDSSCWDSVQHDRVTAQTSDIGAPHIYSLRQSPDPDTGFNRERLRYLLPSFQLDADLGERGVDNDIRVFDAWRCCFRFRILRFLLAVQTSKCEVLRV